MVVGKVQGGVAQCVYVYGWSRWLGCSGWNRCEQSGILGWFGCSVEVKPWVGVLCCNWAGVLRQCLDMWCVAGGLCMVGLEGRNRCEQSGILVGCMAVTDDYMCGLEVMYVQELLGSVYA